MQNALQTLKRILLMFLKMADYIEKRLHYCISPLKCANFRCNRLEHLHYFDRFKLV